MWRAVKQLISVGTIVGAAALGVLLSTFLAGGSQLLSVQSGSMTPAIKKGDLVSVQRTPTRDLRVGDVITYTSPDNPAVTVTHRIVSMTGDMAGRIVTQGDANGVADQAVLPKQIVGRVEHRLPYMGFVVDAIRHPLGLIGVIYLPALIVLVFEIRRLTDYYRRMRPYSINIGRVNGGLPELQIPSGLAAVLVAGAVVLGVAVPASAALRSRAQLADSSITFASQAEPEVKAPHTVEETPEPAKPESSPKPQSREYQHREGCDRNCYDYDDDDRDGRYRYRR